mmetsp:Transcript_3547/g.2576  ORF Transcript_3547/g.2576 Transcript_3547/m.2576 type:complete len:121 (-) Transcript_3547:433-795(-)
MMYSPQCTCSSLPPTPKQKSRSCFNPFFYIENGIISLSLRDTTLIGCLLITVSLLYFLYATCTDGTFECSREHLPWISDTICLPFYDRIFCLFSTFMMYCCFQVDIRAFYHLLNGIATEK